MKENAYVYERRQKNRVTRVYAVDKINRLSVKTCLTLRNSITEASLGRMPKMKISLKSANLVTQFINGKYTFLHKSNHCTCRFAHAKFWQLEPENQECFRIQIKSSGSLKLNSIEK